MKQFDMAEMLQDSEDGFIRKGDIVVLLDEVENEIAGHGWIIECGGDSPRAGECSAVPDSFLRVIIPFPRKAK